MATEDLIAALQGGMRVDSVGSFSFDREKAREKLRTFQVAEPQRYVLHLVALATLKGASRLEIECDSDDLIARFDGTITAEDLDDLYNASFAAAHTDLQRARQQLAIGLHAALALNPRHVRLTSGTLTMLARHAATDEIGAVEEALVGTQIHVKQRFRPGLLVRFVKHLRGTLAEATWLRERGRYAGLAIVLNGEQVSGGLQLAEADHVRAGSAGGCHGVAGLLTQGYGAGLGGVIRLVRHGVWICDEWRAWLPEGLVAVVASDRLLTDLSGDKVVQDEEHARAVALGVELAAQVVAQAVGGKREVELEQGLAARLRGCWRAWPGALDAQTVVGEALGRVVMFTDLWGRRCTLARLREEVGGVGHLAQTDGEFAAVLPVGEALVMRKGDAFVDSVLALAFGERRKDVTAELERAAQAELRRRRWRAQPSDARLNAGNYVLTAPLAITVGDREVVGEVGVRRAKSEGCTLRVIVDGHVLTEIEMTAPIAGVDAVIAGPLTIAPEYTGPVRDELFAAALVAWLAAARGLAEQALRGGLVAWGPGPGLQELLYGLLRALRGEGLRATLKAGGYEGEALAGYERALGAALPVVAVPEDMAQEAWMREVFRFTTAGGLQLSVGAVAVGLRQGLPVTWVPETAASHPGISAPVLRVDGRGRDLLRWLFPGQVKRMEAEAYALLLGEATLRSRPEERFAAPAKTHLASVVTVHEGVKVGLAFARTRDDWEMATARASATIFHSGRTLTQVDLWSPVLGVGYAIAGEHLTMKPGFTGVVPDDAYFATLQKAAAAVLVLVREAIAEVGRGGTDEAAASWRRGLLAALTASFPSTGLRDAYARLAARHGVSVGLGRYEELLTLASRVHPGMFERELEQRRADPEGLDDLRGLAAALSVPPPTRAEVEAVAGVLRELRGMLGQTGGATLLDEVMACSPELGELALFERVDGSPVTLQEARTRAQGGKLHVFLAVGGRRPLGYLRSLRVDSVTHELLQRLYGAARLTTDPIAERDEEGGPARVVPTRRTASVTPARVDPLLEDPPPTATDLAALFAELETEAQARAEVAPTSAVKHEDEVLMPDDLARPRAPRQPAPPSPAERLIRAVRSELDVLRRGHEALLTGFNLDHVRAAKGRGAAVSIAADGLRVHVDDRAVQRVIAGHVEDPVLVSFLVSRVYTALNVWREDITDVDEEMFHARHLAWLAEGGDRRT